MRMNTGDLLVLQDLLPGFAMISREPDLPISCSHNNALIVTSTGLSSLEVRVSTKLLWVKVNLRVGYLSARRGFCNNFAGSLDFFVKLLALIPVANVSRNQSPSRATLVVLISFFAFSRRCGQRFRRHTFLSVFTANEVKIAFEIFSSTIAFLELRNRVLELFADEASAVCFPSPVELLVAHETIRLSVLVQSSRPIFEVFVLAFPLVELVKVKREDLWNFILVISLNKCEQDELQARRIRSRHQPSRIELLPHVHRCPIFAMIDRV